MDNMKMAFNYSATITFSASELLGLIEHRNGTGCDTKLETHSPLGVMGFPSSSRALEISNTERIDATAM
jgi:hypothetical protein